MEFSNISTESLTAKYAALKSMPDMEDVAELMLAELASRKAAEILAAESAGLRADTDFAAELLARIARSPVSDVSDPEGTTFKHAALTLRGLVMTAYDISKFKAEKVLMVLADTSGATNVAGVVSDAVAYVEAHKTSTVYGTTDPADPSKGSKDNGKPESKGSTDPADPGKGSTDPADPGKGSTDPADPSKGSTDPADPSKGSQK